MSSWEIAFWLSSALFGGIFAATADYPLGLLLLAFLAVMDVWIYVQIRRGGMRRSNQPIPFWVRWLLGFAIIVLGVGLFADTRPVEWATDAILIFGIFALLMSDLATRRATDDADPADQT